MPKGTIFQIVNLIKIHFKKSYSICRYYFYVTFSFVAFYKISQKCLIFSQYQKKCKIVVGHQDNPTQLHLLPNKIQLLANSEVLSPFMLQLSIQKATLWLSQAVCHKQYVFKVQERSPLLLTSSGPIFTVTPVQYCF